MSLNTRPTGIAAIAASLLSFGCLAGTLALFRIAEISDTVIAAGFRLA